jgi:NADH dehydrogenase/putative oxidoreductase
MDATTFAQARRLRRANLTASLMGRVGDLLRLATVTLSPILDLAIRLWLAQVFWISGILKLHDWDRALYLAEHEYPVTWMNPHTAAWLGVAIEVMCPIFLAMGLMTRFAAAAICALVLVSQLEYVALQANLLQALLLCWFVVMGAGAISFDRMLGRHVLASAVPFASTINRAFSTLTRLFGPIYQLVVRLSLAVWSMQLTGLMDKTGLVAILGWLALLLFSAGCASRILAAALIVGSEALAMSGAAPGPAGLAYALLAFGLVLLQGPGPLSIDALIEGRLRKRFPQLDGKPASSLANLPHVVVVGAGFGGLAATRALRLVACRVTLIDQRNYHLFQPLLYQVATASLSPSDIASPVRTLLREQFNASVLLGRVTAVDSVQRKVVMGEQRLGYDYLILATGARHSYFGRDDWEPWAPGLKRIDDATDIRRRLLRAFELAETTEDPAEQRSLLNFVIVGAGPTGVELAGAIAELTRHGMQQEFKNFDPGKARVVLVQSGPRILPAFPEELSERSALALADLGVEIMTASRVEQVDAAGVSINGQHLAARTVFWAAGVVASPAAKWLGCAADSAGRLQVRADLSVPGRPEIFAVGDTAYVEAWHGKPVPGLAPAAKQGGEYAAAVIRARLEGGPAPAPFRYRHFGSMATIGRKAAVIDFGRLRLSGALAWWLWGAVHILFLIGARNRISVALEWLWAYLTYRSSTRLITGEEESPA